MLNMSIECIWLPIIAVYVYLAAGRAFIAVVRLRVTFIRYVCAWFVEVHSVQYSSIVLFENGVPCDTRCNAPPWFDISCFRPLTTRFRSITTFQNNKYLALQNDDSGYVRYDYFG